MNKIAKSKAADRINKLREIIKDYRYNYHVLDKSTMSEAAADSLKHELSQLEEAYPKLITPDSPTQTVGGQVLLKFDKVQHSSRMLSLNDVFNKEEVEAWVKRIEKLTPDRNLEFFVDIKMDGLACALIYQDGKLIQGITRGDGFVGEDVTANIKTVKNIPLFLRSEKGYEKFLRGRTEIRGEIIMYKKDFENLNKEREREGKPVYANPRNLAAGTVRQLDTSLTAARPLLFRAYDMIRDESTDLSTNLYTYEAIRRLGIAANNQATVFKDVAGVMKFIKQWEEKRHELPFNTDGLVVKINDRALSSSLGVVGKAPRGAVAYKYPAEESVSIVKEIVISIGRTGAATPVAVLNPVVLAGTLVKHASLHNSDEIARKDIRIGDTVVVFKAGDIIPQVDRVLEELRPKKTVSFDMESHLKWQYPDLKFNRPEGEAVYRLTGMSGKLLLKKSLEHFASRGALDIEGLGEKNVAALVDAGLVDDLADIYLLKPKEVEKLDRFAKLSASNLIDGVANSKHPTLPRFIYGLGIRHVGAQTAIDLVAHFKSIDKIADADLEELMVVEGVGDIVAESIFGWFTDQDNRKLLEKFERVGVKPVFKSLSNGPLQAKKFVITGTLGNMSRDEAGEAIRSLGGTFSSSVGKATDYLVVGENPGDSKRVEANKFRTKELNETEFLKLIDKSV
ncbi:MAG TPA: NAD-dependent DNA ligase LigA [Candidatus Saccharimonadales bacterium]|nr:NAD-dependent DNA ligase LigA [Candidatus Saccharimonadales bacterium]